MKKKVVSALLCATMVATMFAGCGSKESSDNATTPDTSKADTSSEVTAPAEDTGKVLNIYCCHCIYMCSPYFCRIHRKCWWFCNPCCQSC